MTACYDPTHEPEPENPEKLTGPLVGELVRYQYKDNPPIVVKVLARSYVWSPEQHNPSGYHGFRRYMDTVIQTRPTGGRIVVLDTDLSPIEIGTALP